MTFTLPDDLPRIAHAKLPKTYEQAKEALARCSSIDECAEWANKAEALASYARQANDYELRKTADRIQARAIRRCGQLLRAIKPGTNKYVDSTRGGAPPSRSQAARDAGLSRDQKRDALRVAKIPEHDFERDVESDDPPTVTRLAEKGRERKPLTNLSGRDPKEFARATEAHGWLRRMAEFASEYPPDLIARGTMPHERRGIQKHIEILQPWIGTLHLLLDEEETR